MENIRSNQQNKSLHLYCKLLSDALNEAGIPQTIFYQNIQADYTEHSIKSLFKKYAEKQYGKDSTTKLTTKEITLIYDEINRHTSKLGIHIPFPSVESAIINNY